MCRDLLEVKPIKYKEREQKSAGRAFRLLYRPDNCGGRWRRKEDWVGRISHSSKLLRKLYVGPMESLRAKVPCYKSSVSPGNGSTLIFSPLVIGWEPGGRVTFEQEGGSWGYQAIRLHAASDLMARFCGHHSKVLC